MQIKTILISLLLTISLTHCASYDFSRRVVQQGNLLPKAKIERLKIGMSKEDVGILMGSSLLNPPFADNRWDYAFTWRRGLRTTTIRHLTLYFKNDRLIRIDKSS